jgi:hypothetical protein
MAPAPTPPKGGNAPVTDQDLLALVFLGGAA